MRAMNAVWVIVFTGAFVLAVLGGERPQTDNVVQPQGLGPIGALVSLDVVSGRQPVVLSGQDSGQQLVVQGVFQSGQRRDLTRNSQIKFEPAGIVKVDESGYLTPLSEGEATLRIEHEGIQSPEVHIQVKDLTTERTINFPNQITPIFTKHNCNGGGCHGKSGGQNGFRLSLLGFEPKEDFEYIVKEGRGRRIVPAAPERSLLLRKATGQLPHGGGQRIEPGSVSYRLIQKWIEQGMPYGSPTDPVVTRIEIQPREVVADRGSLQQAVVIAHYSDGSSEDVTRTTNYDANDTEMAEISKTGLIKTGQLPGSVAIMARYQGHVDVMRITMPLGVPTERLPPSQNFVDELVFSKLRLLGLPASQPSEDATFLRRVTIDIAGRLPTLEESKAFLADSAADKRTQLIERLLDSEDYADYFANKWSAILRNRRRQEIDKDATFGFHDWIRQSILENKPFDEFVRDVVAASGEPLKNPAVGWYREVKDASSQVEDVAQLFLGLRIQCAKCHHHPFEKWSQNDYYGLSAFFSQVGRKRGELPGTEQIFHRRGVASAAHPKTGQGIKPAGLGAQTMEIPQDEDPREALVDWVTSSENPFFAKSLVNRYWKHFFGRGLVDPEDDMRVTNPASNPVLLDALASSFVQSRYDLKQLIRTICNSTVYQLSSEPNEWNRDDKQNFSRYYPKRLTAEVLLDSINSVTSTATSFGSVPMGTRAVQLPDSGFGSYFLTVFGRPEGSSACECERSSDANLAQSLHLLNSSEMQTKLTSGEGRAARLAADQRTHEQRIAELYLVAFSREPDANELQAALSHLEKHKADPKIAYEDIVWAITNTKEFLFNH